MGRVRDLKKKESRVGFSFVMGVLVEVSGVLPVRSQYLVRGSNGRSH